MSAPDGQVAWSPAAHAEAEELSCRLQREIARPLAAVAALTRRLPRGLL
jgi:hypothetical protein